MATAVRKNLTRENQNRRKERSPENPGPNRSRKTPAQEVTVVRLNQRGKTRGKNETPRKKRKSVDQGDVAQITKILAHAQDHQRLK